MDTNNIWVQILLGVGTNFIATLAGVFVALVIRDRIYYRRLYDGWRVCVTYAGEELLPEGRTIGWTKAKEISGSTAEESVLLKGIVSPYVWLNCDLITEGRDVEMLVDVDEPKRFFGNKRTYLIDFRPGELAGLVTFTKLAQQRIDQIKVRQGLVTPEASAAEAQQPAALSGAAAADGLLVLNFAHPLTPEQQAAIETALGAAIDGAWTSPDQTKIDPGQPIVPQVRAIVDSIGLTPDEWQGRRILIVPPGYAPATSALMAELHGRMGHFPSIIRIRPVPGSTPQAYEVGEIVNLQSTARDPARGTRAG